VAAWLLSTLDDRCVSQFDVHCTFGRRATKCSKSSGHQSLHANRVYHQFRLRRPVQSMHVKSEISQFNCKLNLPPERCLQKLTRATSDPNRYHKAASSIEGFALPASQSQNFLN